MKRIALAMTMSALLLGAVALATPINRGICGEDYDALAALSECRILCNGDENIREIRQREYENNGVTMIRWDCACVGSGYTTNYCTQRTDVPDDPPKPDLCDDPDICNLGPGVRPCACNCPPPCST